MDRDEETTVKKEGVAGRSLIDLVFFRSLRDVLSRDLYKHQTDGIVPLELLVIDEAAQLKECESAILLQLPGLHHAILIGEALLELDQLHIPLDPDSLLFKNAKWKVWFSNAFKNSISKVKDTKICQSVISSLERLSSGWRQSQNDKEILLDAGTSAQLLYKYEVNSLLYLIWSVDVIQQNSVFIQVIKIWDILPLSDILRLAKSLDTVFGAIQSIR
ncbi:hypothetical protein D8674_010546 [Pyrus ussuriensis x Pyrus communis]|uniref:DNA2/NAM7 helicase helicase domain-containing protein n=1 Tax=Pyrus ussuriensis x Pyrus communis TaxID=2448454 RepID=A0A5N5FB27_9ROSA|nr:hypothetical protein D8674_010546 [Pyrus ussuriensis x Pyrus communis]